MVEAERSFALEQAGEMVRVQPKYFSNGLTGNGLVKVLMEIRTDVLVRRAPLSRVD